MYIDHSCWNIKMGWSMGFTGGEDFSKIPNVNPELYLSGSDDLDL